MNDSSYFRHYCPSLEPGRVSRCGLYTSKGAMDTRTTMEKARVTCFRCREYLKLGPLKLPLAAARPPRSRPPSNHELFVGCAWCGEEMKEDEDWTRDEEGLLEHRECGAARGSGDGHSPGQED